MRGRGRIGIVIAISATIAAGIIGWNRCRGGARPPPGAGHTAAGGAATGHAAGPPGTPPPPWFGAAAAGDRRIAGHVFVAGKPGAATLELRSAATDVGALPATGATAGTDGAFDLGHHRAGVYRLQATAPGSVPAAVVVDCSAADADAIELFLAPCRAVVEGEVRDASGGPIVGATIETDGFPVATTDRGGRYQLCIGPEPTLTARAEGYASAQRTLREQTSLDLDFELVPEAVLDVTVVDAAARPVAGALVTATPAVARRRGLVLFDSREPAPRPITAVTGADGRASLRGVPDLDHHLTATTGTLATADPITVSPTPGETTEATIEVTATITIHGRAVTMKDEPAPGVQVRWFVGDVESAAGTSGADGEFVIERAAPGSGAFVVDPPAYAQDADYVAAADASPARVVVYLADLIRGRVLRAGSPVGGAEVRVLGMGSLPARSRADGGYALPRLGFMKGTIELEAVSHAVGAFGQRTLELPPDPGPLAGIDIELAWGGSIRGVVVDQTGAPVGGVAVSFDSQPLHDVGHGTTGADGAFVATLLHGGGPYTVKLEYEGSELGPVTGDGWPEVAVDENGRVDSLRLIARVDRRSVAGLVVDTAGRAVADARVVLHPAMRTTRSGADGRFQVSTTHLGPFSVEVRASGERTGLATGIAAGSHDVRVVVGDPGNLHATCDDPGAAVRVVSTSDSAGAPTSTGLRCGDTISLPAGRYRLGSMWVDQVVEVASGVTTEVHVEIPAMSMIEATATPPAGASLAGVRCTFDAVRGTRKRATRIDADRAPVMKFSVPRGHLDVSCEGGGLVGRTAVEADGPVTTIRIALAKAPPAQAPPAP